MRLSAGLLTSCPPFMTPFACLTILVLTCKLALPLFLLLLRLRLLLLLLFLEDTLNIITVNMAITMSVISLPSTRPWTSSRPSNCCTSPKRGRCSTSTGCAPNFEWHTADR